MSHFKTGAVALIAASAFATSALAGGYSRGSANLDPLFDDGTSFAASMTIVAPSRGLKSFNGVPADRIPTPTGGRASDKFTSNYVTFGATAATDIAGGVRCGVSYAQPFGADANYGWTRIAASIATKGTPTDTTTSTSLSSTELGATCGYGMDMGKGKLHLIGGVFYQSLSYSEARGFGYDSFVTGARGGDLSFSGDGVGYRLGVGYTIPEIALKASLTYRSEVSHRLTGNVRSVALGGVVAGYINARTPQSVKLSVQSGIAPGWLAFGSVEWTDWSVLQQPRVFTQVGNVPLPLTVDAFFQDGWTVSGGIAHAFTDKFSGLVSVTWDQGVSAGRNISSFGDSWTFAVGANYNASDSASLRAGLAYTILNPVTENQVDGDVLQYGADYAIGGGLSFNVKF